MRYACLVYFDPTRVFDGSPEAEAVLRDGYRTIAELKEGGRLVSDAALQLPNSAKTVRVRDGRAAVTDGPFMETKEMLGGFLIVEATDLDEALRIAGEVPLAKLGSVEVRPLVDFSQPRPKL